YYFRSYNSCGWGTQGSATVTINSTPSSVSVSGGGTYCNSATLTASGGSGGTIYWQGATSGGTSTTNSTNPQTVTTSGTYYFRAYNSCGWGTQGSATVTINTTPSEVTVSGGGTFCNSATLSAGGGSGGTIYWQGNTSGGTSTTNSTNPQTVTSSGTYYFRSYNSCGWGTQGSATVIINPVPTSPILGTITQPTCTVTTGGVVLNGLPATGTWTLTRTPGGTITSGTGTSSTITGLTAGTYTYTVTNSSGCTSLASANIVINAQPTTPTAPTIGTITQPSCTTATGNVVLNGLPSSGTWTLTRTPGGTITTGTGTSTTITSLVGGTYTFTVTNASGCTSVSSANVVINAQPTIPSAPTVGAITQPTCAIATGSVILSGLPSTGTWTLTLTPGGTATTGTGTSTTISGLAAGTYTYTVTNSSGCTSIASSNVVINTFSGTPNAPILGTITQPTCTESNGSVVLNGLPTTGTWTLTVTPGGTTTTGIGTSTTITGLAAGIYSYTVTNSSGCTSVASANVIINVQPIIPTAPTIGTITQPTCTVATGGVVLNGLPATGTWTLTRSPGGTITNGTGASSTITGLTAGTYTYTVTNSSGCTSLASANIIINSQPTTPIAPTIGLITQPSCTTATGNVVLNGLPSSGTWTLTKTPGGTITTGTGTNTTITGLASGTYTFTVTNSYGCTSVASANVVINAQPAPTVSVITTNTSCSGNTGTATANVSNGTPLYTYLWSDGQTTQTATGLGAGSYSVTVTDGNGCIVSSSVNINFPSTYISQTTDTVIIDLFFEQKSINGNNFVFFIDYNNDGKTDMLTRENSSGKIFSYRNTGTTYIIEDTLNANAYSYSANPSSKFYTNLCQFYTDMDNDGNNDLVIYSANHSNCSSNSVRVYWGNASFPYFSDAIYTNITLNYAFCVGAYAVDFDNDGLKDIFVRTAGTGAETMSKNNGNRSFSTVTTINTGRDIGVNFDDYDGDGFADLCYTKNGWADSQWGIRFNKGLGTGDFNASTIINYSAQRPVDDFVRFAADPLSDTVPDILFNCSNDGTNGGNFYWGEWSQTLNNFTFDTIITGNNTESTLIQAIDYNSDGYEDVIMRYKTGTNPYYYTTIAYLNDGFGNFNTNDTIIKNAPYSTFQLFKDGNGLKLAAYGNPDTLYVFSVTQIHGGIPTDGLVAHYPFNGNANDESGNALHGIVHNNVVLTTDRNGNPNSAYYFTGGTYDWIEVANNPLLNLGPDFTVSAWVVKTGTNGIIINKGRDISCGTWGLSTNTIGINGTCGTNTGTSVDVTLNEWHMVTGVLDGNNGKLRFYQDAQLIAEVVTNSFTANNNYPIAIGRHCTDQACGSAWPYPFMGKIDDIIIYNRTLNQSEINQLYQSTSAPSVPIGISLGNDTTICSNQTIALDAGAGFNNYHWSTNENTQSISVSNLNAGIHQYTVTVTACGSTAADTINVNISPTPDSAGIITGITTVCSGQNAVTYTVPSIVNATSYVWTLPGGATGTSNTNSITVDYSDTAVSGNITVKGNNSCGDGAISALTIAVNGYIISGKTLYMGKANAGNPIPNQPTYNSAIYNLDKVIVILKNQYLGTEIARDTSDASGAYEFRCITDGNYTLSYDKYTSDTMQWGNNVNAVDLALLKYLIGHDTLTDPSRSFAAKHKRAANIDNNTTINTIDIARIASKVGLPYTPARNFPRGNWVALDTSVTVAGSNLNITLKTICYGDYDASSTKYKDSTLTWSMAKSLPDENIILRSDESVTTNNNGYFEVPLRINAKMNEFSAMGLELSYPSEQYKLVSASMPNTGKKSDAIKINPTLEEIIAANNDLLVTDIDGVIRVVFATTDHFDIAANVELVRLGFRSLNDPGRGELDFNLSGTGLIANQYGEINEDAYLTMPKIFVQGDELEAGFEFAGYPNPFSGDATLTYSIPENGTVKLSVYNAIGELVTLLVNETQIIGTHSAVFSPLNLPAGMYTFKLEFTGSDKSKCIVLKMIH
ncbi:MAG TPA: FG-GAP-like repeat-containing protein, partial [Paludibacteraceae bacterium]|nr:FG-GAP-like repeat-containing protein [Paludibacteraceae bacterium]